MDTTNLKIKDGVITLPPQIRESWRNANIFLMPDKNTLIIKKQEKNISQLSDLTSRIFSEKMSLKEINKEIKNFRKNK